MCPTQILALQSCSVWWTRFMNTAATTSAAPAMMNERNKGLELKITRFERKTTSPDRHVACKVRV